MSPDNGILLNGVLRPKMQNNPFVSCSLINPDSLLSHTAGFDDEIHVPFFVFNIFEFTFPVSLCTLNNMSTCFYITCKF